MKKAMILATIFSTFATSSLALAETTTFDVEGMHCGSCAKAVKAQVCAMDGLEKCDVTVGKVVISPKAGVSISQDQIQAAIAKAGEYKVTGSKKSQ